MQHCPSMGTMTTLLSVKLHRASHFNALQLYRHVLSNHYYILSLIIRYVISAPEYIIQRAVHAHHTLLSSVCAVCAEGVGVGDG